MNTLKYLYYRLIGLSDIQAKFRLEHPIEAKPVNISIETEGMYLGTMLMGGLILIAYFIQSIYGLGDLFDPTPKGKSGFNELILLGAWCSREIGQALAFQHAIPMQFLYDVSTEDQTWRLFTYTLLHGGFFHVLFNLMTLKQIGPLIEETFGFSRLIFAWVFAGAGAILLPKLVGIEQPLVVGASGSIFGLIGITMAFGHFLKTPEGLYLRNKMIEWTVICTIFGFAMGGVAHAAHFGGLVSGWILAILLPPPFSRLQKKLSIVVAILAIVCMLYSLYESYRFFEESHIEFENLQD